MSTKDFVLHLLSLTLVVFVLSSCGGAQATSAPNRAPLTAPTVITTRGDKDWDYVALGNSSHSSQFDVFPRYAAILEKDLGVEVRVHNWTENGQTSSELLKALRSNESLRKDIREAEAVTFIIPMDVFQSPTMTLLSSDPAQCGGADHQDCLRQALKEYQADTDAIFAQLVSLHSPSEALLRTMDMYQLEARGIRERGVSEVVGKYWREANEYVIQVATRYHIPVARVYAAFMGTKGDEDPMDKGYLADSIHPSYEGADAIAGLLRKLGYEYAPKP